MTRRCYTVAQVREALSLGRSQFFDLRKQGKLPFLEELKPRLGRTPRYRADLVDRYIAGEFRYAQAARSDRRFA